MATQKPDLTRVWANNAPPSNVVDPDNTTPGKVAAGWQAEVPPFEHFNFLQKWFTQGLAHNNERGINEWDTDTAYLKGALVSFNNIVFKALSATTGTSPNSDHTVWAIVSSVDSMTELQSIPSTSYDDGHVISANGYASKGDTGLISFYKWDAASTASAIPGQIIIPTDAPANGRLILQNPINVFQFGAVFDGSTDDSTFIQNAVNSGAEKILGYGVGGKSGTVIDNNINVPDGVVLEFPYLTNDPRDATGLQSYDYRMIVDSSASIILNEGSGIRGFVMLRKGMTLPADAAEVALFAGTAITLPANKHGQYIGYGNVVGFNIAVDSNAATNTEQARLEWLNIDCTNGISLNRVFDIAYVKNIHCWPSASIGVNGGSPLAVDLHRSGVAFDFADGGDWNKVTDCFSYGYFRGFRINNCKSINMISCSADDTTAHAGSVGLEVLGTSNEISVTNGQFAAKENGTYINCAGRVTFVNSNSWGCTKHNALIYNASEVVYNTCVFRGALNGLSVTNAGVKVDVVGASEFQDNGIGVNPTVSTGNVKVSKETVFTNVTTPINSNVGIPLIASAASLAVENRFSTYSVTGTTNITAIQNGIPGEELTLYFNDVLTVVDGGNLQLAGNFVTTIGATLKLVCLLPGTYSEISRSNN